MDTPTTTIHYTPLSISQEDIGDVQWYLGKNKEKKTVSLGHIRLAKRLLKYSSLRYIKIYPRLQEFYYSNKILGFY